MFAEFVVLVLVVLGLCVLGLCALEVVLVAEGVEDAVVDITSPARR
jgi:hypothetical protein